MIKQSVVRLSGIVVIAALIAGCAGNKPSPSSAQPETRVNAAAAKALTSDVPVLQDRQASKVYTASEGRQLERRNGYRVDHSLRTEGANERIQTLVIHYTAEDDQHSIEALEGNKVGVHYLVTSQPGRYQRQPVVLQMADESKRAWHAGRSSWDGRTGLNDTSIGIEIVNKGFTKTPDGLVFSPFSMSQIALVTALAKDIVTRYGIDPTHVVGHSDIAPGRKLDPGPFFPWQQLAQAGIGAWPEASTVAYYRQRFDARLPTVAQLQRGLASYGYDITVSGDLDQPTRRVLASFQMHFSPTRYDGNYDAETAAILFALVSKYRSPRQAALLLAQH
ncbi:N-acetylmuramoyl-L-alanine amidase [Carnimonas nigrificans]|uniref:N-acetylmuramoyl-L-alanine amidase n=1 Tax=Carnimonas nigrificans TaxID=64323 RepID=UPI000470CB2C|nr:N-acetylmuramoyl-L-alanine amidase [Carnimonas nigrificans]